MLLHLAVSDVYADSSFVVDVCCWACTVFSDDVYGVCCWGVLLL